MTLIDKMFIPLTGEHFATITSTKVGQQPINEGDEMIVEASLELPAQDRRLVEALRFGPRLAVLGSALFEAWGFDGGESPSSRVMTRRFTALTYALAARDAEKSFRLELNKLVSALRTRAEILANADV